MEYIIHYKCGSTDCVFCSRGAPGTEHSFHSYETALAFTKAQSWGEGNYSSCSLTCLFLAKRDITIYGELMAQKGHIMKGVIENFGNFDEPILIYIFPTLNPDTKLYVASDEVEIVK